MALNFPAIALAQKRVCHFPRPLQTLFPHDFFSKKPNAVELKDETSSIYLDENPFDR